MKKNIGNIDKVIRFIIVALIVGLFFTNVVTGILAYILLAFAAVFTLTSFIGFCPLYTLFGINTCKIKEEK